MHHERADEVAYPSQLDPGGWNTLLFIFVVVVCERLDFLLGATLEPRVPCVQAVSKEKIRVRAFSQETFRGQPPDDAFVLSMTKASR
jgi:hypothetical protein